jgi:dCMP deaminase
MGLHDELITKCAACREYAVHLFDKQGGNCLICNKGMIFANAKLQAIDPELGYVEGNIRWLHEVCHRFVEKYKDKVQDVEIPSWEEYFLNIAKAVSTRSKDAQTKHGCVITDKRHHILGTGFNSFPRESPDHVMPNLRDSKYLFMAHAERNALHNCIVSPWTFLDGCTAYVTGKPCLECLYALWQENVNKIVILDRQGSFYEDKDKDDFDFFIQNHEIEFVQTKHI